MHWQHEHCAWKVAFAHGVHHKSDAVRRGLVRSACNAGTEDDAPAGLSSTLLKEFMTSGLVVLQVLCWHDDSALA